MIPRGCGCHPIGGVYGPALHQIWWIPRSAPRSDPSPPHCLRSSAAGWAQQSALLIQQGRFDALDALAAEWDDEGWDPATPQDVAA